MVNPLRSVRSLNKIDSVEYALLKLILKSKNVESIIICIIIVSKTTAGVREKIYLITIIYFLKMLMVR